MQKVDLSDLADVAKGMDAREKEMVKHIGEVLVVTRQNRRIIIELQRWRDYLDKHVDGIYERLREIESKLIDDK